MSYSLFSVFCKVLLKFILAHQDFSCLRSLLGSDNAGFGKLIHDTSGTVKADAENSLQMTDGGLFLVDDVTAGLGKQLIGVTLFLSSGS